MPLLSDAAPLVELSDHDEDDEEDEESEEEAQKTEKAPLQKTKRRLIKVRLSLLLTIHCFWLGFN